MASIHSRTTSSTAAGCTSIPHAAASACKASSNVLECSCVPALLQLFEYWLHPQRYRTQLCNSGSSCQRNLCFFAHSTAELRTPGSTHELHIPIPSLVTTADAAGTDSTLVGPPGQHVIEDLSSAPFAVDPGSVHWPVEESSSSFSSQPSRVLSSLAPCVSSSSETSLAVFPSSHIVMGLPGQAAQTALPVTAVFTQQQQELQRRQARFMELQLRLHQQQQQDHMRAAVLQMEVQQQHVLAAAPHPMLVGGHPTAFAGLDQGLEQGVRIFTPGNSLGIHHNFTPNTTAGITSVCPINLALPATAVAVDLINTSPGQCTQPVGGLVGQAVPGSNILPSVNMAATLASLANLSLPSMNLVEPTSGAIPFGGGANMLLISEPLLSAHGGGFVQSCMWKS